MTLNSASAGRRCATEPSRTLGTLLRCPPCLEERNDVSHFSRRENITPRGHRGGIEATLPPGRNRSRKRTVVMSPGMSGRSVSRDADHTPAANRVAVTARAVLKVQFGAPFGR